MLSSKKVFLVGLLVGAVAQIIWTTHIYYPSSATVALLLFGGPTLILLPQFYIEGKLQLPLLERVVVPSRMKSKAKQLRRFSILYVGFFTPFFLGVGIHIVLQKI